MIEEKGGGIPMSTPTPEQMAPHMYLTFAEATIISANRMMKDKSSFLQRLTDLLNHTTDRVLPETCKAYMTRSLLSEPAFDALIQAAAIGEVMFPVNYRLPLDETI